MAAVSLSGSTFNTTAGTHTVTCTPAVNDLIIIVSAKSASSSAAWSAPFDNASGTYTKAVTGTQNNSNSVQIYVRDQLVSSSASTVFGQSGGSDSGGGLAVLRATGMTFAGSAALVKTGVVSAHAASTPDVPWTGGGSAGGANPLVGVVFNATNPAGMAKPASFDTERLDTGWASPTTGIEIVSDNTGNTDSRVTWGGASASQFAALILELTSSTGPVSVTAVSATASAGAVVSTGVVTGIAWAASGTASAAALTAAAITGAPPATTSVTATSATASAAAPAPAVREQIVGTVASASATAGDQYTVLLLHADGTDASTSFPDSSPALHSITAVGNAQVDTAQSEFGGGSALVAGGGDRLAVADHADFKFGTGDFTIDLWVNLGTTDGGSICAKRVSTLYGPFTIFQSYGTSDVDLFISSTGAGWDIVPGTSIASGVTLGTWHHVALTRSGTTIRAFWDGVQSLSASTAASLFDNSTDLTFGAAADGAESFHGQLDEIRVTKGTSRWDSNFTPPAAPYTSFLYPVVQEQIVSTVASASAAALAPAVREQIAGTVASASAAAPTPSVVAASATNITATSATASAAAPAPTVQEQIAATVASASASAPTPSVVSGLFVSATVASATATAVGSGPGTVEEEIGATVASASAAALIPAIGTGTLVSAPVAAATASAPIPAVSERMVATDASAAASAPAPAVFESISAPTAATSATAPSGVVSERIVATVASASAAAAAPTIREQIVATVASASAAAPTPSLIVPSLPLAITAAAAVATAVALVPDLRTIFLTAVVCDTLTLTATACGALTLTSANDGALTLASASDTTPALSGASDGVLVLAESATVT